jgi:hypothetical protein
VIDDVLTYSKSIETRLMTLADINRAMLAGSRALEAKT